MIFYTLRTVHANINKLMCLISLSSEANNF